jgi:energy-coupling factor transporter ATP-binding protein EcfA2
MPGILSYFNNLTLTEDQRKAALQIEQFLIGPGDVFLLKGYAGTGKTTMLEGVCQFIARETQRPMRLMAPTGRAAKVLADKNAQDATTIHKGIYNFKVLETSTETEEDGEQTFKFIYKIASDANVYRHVFIVDEASMVSDAQAESEFFRFGTGRVLHDLLTYAKAGQVGADTKLIFVGDPAQLPPFGMMQSPALEEAYIQEKFRLRVQSVELQQSIRQGTDSGALAVATSLRQALGTGFMNQFMIDDNGNDLRVLPFDSFQPEYDQANPNKIVITYQNKTAKDLNLRIRKQRWSAGSATLMPGDMIIVGMNNYQHNVRNGTFGMISWVGEAEKRTIHLRHKVRGLVPVILTWRVAEVQFRNDEGSLRTERGRVLENFLLSDESRLQSDEFRALYVDFIIRHPKLKKGTPEFSNALKIDPYFNALMLKYGYAVTCHKAQGGEWKDVFTFWDHDTRDNANPYTDQQTDRGLTNSAFFRWAYTAVTRSKVRLLAINPPRFTPFTKMGWVDTHLANQFLASQGITAEQLIWGNEQQVLMERLQLAHRERFVQYKVASLAHLLAPEVITIDSVRSSSYQESLCFHRNGESTWVNFWYNGKGQFTRYQKSHGSDTLFSSIDSVLRQPLLVTFEENSSTASKPGADLTTDGSKPFVDLLRQLLVRRCADESIQLQSATSLQYCERCQLGRGSEQAVIDFIYDGQGFFTEARPLAKQSNSTKLLTDLQRIIQNFHS